MAFPMANLKFFWIILLIMVACKASEEKARPAHILSQEEMIPVMMDIHLAETMIDFKKLKGTDTSKIMLASWYQQLFEKYEISDTIFYDSFNYYLENPAELNEIYEALLEELNKK